MSNICNKLPIGKQLMATDELFRKEMHSLFDEIREHAPIMEDKELSRWAITKHGYVREILRKKTVCVRDWEKYSAENTFARKMGEQIGKLGMLDMDGNGHRNNR